jgi:hypothetical protein
MTSFGIGCCPSLTEDYFSIKKPGAHKEEE